MGNCCQCNKDKPLSESQYDNNETDNNIIENHNFYLAKEEDINNIPSSPTEQRLNTYEGRINSKFNLQKNSTSSLNKICSDKPNILDAFLRKEKKNCLNDLISESKSEGNRNDNQFNVSLISMENKLFDLINNLRTNPKSLINKVEEYKEKLQKNDDYYFLIIDENKFEFQKGAKCFDECIDFLKKQKTLKKFHSSPSMFESKISFQDKNVSDLNFVLIYNLMDIQSPEENKIKRNSLTSEIYNKLNITITIDDFVNELFTFYFSFDE